MTKNEFKADCQRYGCTTNYSGNTGTMYVFGGWEGLQNLMGADYKAGKRYEPDWLKFAVVATAVN